MNKTVVTLLTHLVAFLLGLGIMYLSGGKPSAPQAEEAKVLVREATAIAFAEGQKAALSALAAVSSPVKELAGPAIEVVIAESQPRIEAAVDNAIDKLVPPGGTDGHFSQYVGSYKYAGTADSKYSTGTLKIEAGRTGKEGVKDTPFNLTFFLVDRQKKVFEGGCGYYDTGLAFCRTDVGNPKEVTKKNATVSMKKVGNALVLDIPEVGLSEHFIQ